MTNASSTPDPVAPTDPDGGPPYWLITLLVTAAVLVVLLPLPDDLVVRLEAAIAVTVWLVDLWVNRWDPPDT